ncbi:EI24 domain-containing protein [Planktotalea sp.]|uniref:EI24 domain-containing protein n=1 Tax=Planktotalea sp. TaxID=2029877 RepID=UPI0035C821F0
MILWSFFKAIGQMGDPWFRRVLLLGVALTIALLAGFYALFLTLMNEAVDGTMVLPVIGEVTWLGDLLGWGSLFLMLFLSTFLMVPVASAITSLFLDEVASGVEAKHYAHLPPVKGVSFYESLRDTINFLGILIGANIVAVLLYVMLPFAAIFIFWALNGFLLGREYFQIAAMRRLGREGAKQARKEHFGSIWLAGCLMAVPLTVPLLNLFIPILGAATFTHLFHQTQMRRPSD